jgi:bifunctional DNase/RNase
MAALLGGPGCAGSKDQVPPDEPLTQETPDAPDIEALQATPDGFQRVQVLQVMMTPHGYAVLLGDESGDRITPIFVGETNAMSIHLRQERRRYERPLTHDLLDNMLERLDARVVKVHIDAIKTGVFVGTVFVATATEVYEFDARSSDAIALAVGNDVPIFIANDVVDQASISRDELEHPATPESLDAPGPTTESL